MKTQPASQHQEQMITNDWKNMSTDEAYKLSISEFKGATLVALQDIRTDIHEIKRDIAITRYISLAVAGISGLISGLFSSKLQ